MSYSGQYTHTYHSCIQHLAIARLTLPGIWPAVVLVLYFIQVVVEKMQPDGTIAVEVI